MFIDSDRIIIEVKVDNNFHILKVEILWKVYSLVPGL